MIIWPATLPQLFRQDGYSEKFPDPTISTQMDSGPVKKRPRYTAAPVPVQGTMVVNSNQVIILEDFFKSETKFGSLQFQWLHPRTQQQVYFRFKESPRIEPFGEEFVITLSLEIMP